MRPQSARIDLLKIASSCNEISKIQILLYEIVRKYRHRKRLNQDE